MRTNSKKPSKQRLYEYKISKHEQHKLVSAPLSKKLQEERGIRTLPVREGDEVIVVRGNHKGKDGKVNKTDPSRGRIFVEGMGARTTEGQEIAIPIHASNVIIQKINSRDRYRRESVIRRRIEDEEKVEEVMTLLEEEAEEQEEEILDFEDEEFEEDELLLDDEMDLDGLEDVDELIEEADDEEFELIDDIEEEEEKEDEQ